MTKKKNRVLGKTLSLLYRERGMERDFEQMDLQEQANFNYSQMVAEVGEAEAARLRGYKFESFEARTAAILSRYSLLDMREVGDEDLERGTALMMKANLKVEVLGYAGFIECFRVTGDKVHEVRRFERLAFCSCHDFFYGNCCKDVAATFPPTCKCGRMTMLYGEICGKCEQKNAPYLKHTIDKKPERLGGVRF